MSSSAQAKLRVVPPRDAIDGANAERTRVVADQPPVDFDPAFIAALVGALPPEQLATLLTDFLEGTADRLDRVNDLAAAGLWAHVAREAHDLVSICGNYGLTRACTIARALVAACKANPGQVAQTLVHDLTIAAAQGSAAMRAHLQSGAPVRRRWVEEQSISERPSPSRIDRLRAQTAELRAWADDEPLAGIREQMTQIAQQCESLAARLEDLRR